ncbi:Dolichyl-phosphate-mannose--protein mannosyltransferase family GT39 [Gracilaria domingensis]|nr:Dolichyl-phosphate-mannose--protein mannosyltransferase family GT39 [Gracilaria domingensis]
MIRNVGYVTWGGCEVHVITADHTCARTVVHVALAAAQEGPNSPRFPPSSLLSFATPSAPSSSAPPPSSVRFEMTTSKQPELRRRRGKQNGDSLQPGIAFDATEKSLKFGAVKAQDRDPAAKLGKIRVAPANRPPVFTVYQTVLDWVIMIALFVAAGIVRFYKLAYPDVVVFDEIHYLAFDNHVLNGTYFFDVNPVWGKLVIAFFARLVGYDPSHAPPGLSEKVVSPLQAFAARAPCAFFGTLTVPVFYKVCRWLHLSTYASVVGSAFILFDCMHVIQSRVAMVDSVLVFWTCFSVMCAFTLWDQKNYIIFKGKDVRVSSVLNMIMLLVVTGINCGLSISVRWTAFATPVLIFIISFFGVGPFLVEPLNFIELLVLYASAFAGYAGSFCLFLLQVNKSGPGDGFMSAPFQACLKGNKFAESGPCAMSYLGRVWEINKQIFNYSKQIRGKDKWGSSWFQWIINWRGALYYRWSDAQKKLLAIIYVLMNPAMTFLINALMAVFIAGLFYVVRYRKQLQVNEALKAHLRRGSVMFFGWVLSMLPTMVVYRSGPVYQYLPGLFFAQALAAVGFDLIPRKFRPAASVLVIAALVAGFVYWSPWVYGSVLSEEDHIRRRWLPRWD